MGKTNKEPLSQSEINRRYREKYNLVLFSVRIEKDLYDKLCDKLKNDGLNKKEFIVDAINKFLKG